MEKVFTKGHFNIAVESFDMSEAFIDDIKKGPGDYSKEIRLKEIEDTLMHYDPSLPKASMIPLALDAAYMSRSLELAKEIIVGKFERAQKIINEFGLPIHKTECAYEWAWTLYWWYEDYSEFYTKYLEFEVLALSAGNIFEIERLSNLWMNLRTCSLLDGQDFDISPHSEKLLNALNEFSSDKSKPHAAFEAEAIKLQICLLMEDDIEKINLSDLVAHYIEIVNDSDNHLDFSLEKLAKILTSIPFLEDAANYDELFELLTTKLAERKQESTRANLLVKRAMKIADENPGAAISYIGRALMDLYTEQSKFKLIVALSLLAYCLESVGCLWAARNYNLYAFALCFTQYTKYGEIHPALVSSSDSLKMIELQLGRISYAVASHKWSVISENLFQMGAPENKFDKKPVDLFEPILAIAIMRTPHEELNKINALIGPLKKYDLYIAEVAAKYMLGYFDEDWLKYYENDTSKFDESMNQLYVQPANQQILSSPWYGTEENALLQTKILGCNISIETTNQSVCLELGSSILAMLESFFATGIPKRILLQRANIIINLVYSNSDSFSIEISDEKCAGVDVIIYCSKYDKDDIVTGQKIVSEFLQELFPLILAKMVMFDVSKDALEELVAEERVFDRAFPFIDSIFFPAQVLGGDYGTAIYNTGSDAQSTESYPLLRESPICFDINTEPLSPPISDDRKLQFIYDIPPEIKREKVTHRQMEIESIIDIPLWNDAKWRGVGVIAARENEFVPLLGLVFKKSDVGQEIFEGWKKRFGDNDVDNEIQVGIIKGIDKQNPYYYRVIITSNLKPSGDPNQIKRVQWICRLHTMEAKTPNNMQILESAIKQNNQFQLALFKLNGVTPEPFEGMLITKSTQSITIRNAWEIEDGSYLLTGVMPTDNPIIPPDFENAPILGAIESKQKFSSKIGRNDLCPCGSGKKYKKCCIDKD